MSLTIDQFIAATGAELAGDKLILGVASTRRFVGGLENGVFTLNAEGQAIAAEIQSGTSTAAALADVESKE